MREVTGLQATRRLWRICTGQAHLASTVHSHSRAFVESAALAGGALCWLLQRRAVAFSIWLHSSYIHILCTRGCSILVD